MAPPKRSPRLPRPERVLLVANPVSGRGRGERAAGELLAGFQRLGIRAECLRTRARGDAQRLLAAAGPADLVVAVGGDGTLSEVLQGLPEARTPVGLFPCGTANVLARSLGLPRRAEPALGVFVGGHLQELDVARVGTRLAHLVLGVGFDALAVHEVEARRRGPITKLAYVSAAWRALRDYRPRSLRVTLDGVPLDGDFGQVWVSNVGRYADLLRLAPDSRLDDGRLEVYLFPSGRRPELVRAFLRGLLGHLPGGAVSMRPARHVRIESAQPVPVQVDGDAAGSTPVEIELLPERYRLVVP